MTLAQIQDTEVHRFTDEVSGAEFEIKVGLPRPSPMQPMPDQTPVLYVLDGDLLFGAAVELSRMMQLFGELPPMVVVGIGYGDIDAAGQLRNRDFTPTRDAQFEAMAGAPRPDFEHLLPEDERFGRADAFRRFLVEQLRPWVADRFAVEAGAETLYGASLGGLFTVHTLLTAPGSFDAYIAASPAIWWDGEVLFAIEEEQRDVPIGARVFLGVGEREEGQPGMEWLDRYRTVTNVRKMAERLAARGDEALQVSSHVFENETHTSVVSAVLTRGLRTAVGPRRPG